MDIQTMVDNAIEAQRAEQMKTSPQMMLGELVMRLESIVDAHREEIGTESEPTIRFDFAGAVPTGFSSWRGSYRELAINYSFNGYGYMKGYKKEDSSTFEPKPPKISEFLAAAKSCIGKTFEGWKGGDFVMGKNTPLWVSNDGDSDNTAVIAVVDEKYYVRIDTSYLEY